MYSTTNQHSTEVRVNKISTGQSTNVTKKIKLMTNRKYFAGDDACQNKSVYPPLYQVLEQDQTMTLRLKNEYRLKKLIQPLNQMMKIVYLHLLLIM